MVLTYLGKSDSYLTKCRGMLCQIMHKAEANDLIHKNPVRLAEKMNVKGPVKRKGAFTQEVLALKSQHIEPDGSCIHIRQA